MDKIEQQIEKLAIAVANGFDEQRSYIDRRFDEQHAYMDARFAAIDERLDDVDRQLRDIRGDIRELREISISLDEQDELRRRLVRVEDHLGLPHELPPKPAM